MGTQSDALMAFNGLPLPEKHKVLLATNPDYASMPGSEQAKVLDSLSYGDAPNKGWRNNLADRIDQGRGMAERGVTSYMRGVGLPTNSDEADALVKGDPNGNSGLTGLWRSHMEAGAKDPVGYVPILGPLSVRASEHARAEQYPEMVGDIGAGVTALSPFREGVGQAGTNLGQRVAKATRTADGELGPVTTGVTRTGGAVGGAVAGYKMTPKGVPPYYGASAGAYAGREVGPLLADRIIPKVNPRITPFEGTNLNWTPPGELLGPENPTAAQLSLGRRVGERTAREEVTAQEPVAISDGPTGSQHAAVRGAQADVARRNARQFVPITESPSAPPSMAVGSSTKEAGYQPPVRKVPFPYEGGAPVTVEQVPGPDTPGKGNWLTPAADRGVPGAGEELVRRGRPTLFTPRESYSGTRLEGSLAERMGQPQNPTLSQRTAPGYKPTEKAATMSDKPRDLGPEWSSQQREEMIQRYKSITRNPSASPADLTEAQARLRELGAVQ